MKLSLVKKILIPLFWIYIGFVFWSISTHEDHSYGRTWVFVLNALSGGFSVYGIICFIAEIKIRKTWKEFLNAIYNNIHNAFKGSNGTTMD
jgi:hypothetical protein